MGQLPYDMCAQIGAQIADATNAVNDIGNNTALYTIDWMMAGPPAFAPLSVYQYQVVSRPIDT